MSVIALVIDIREGRLAEALTGLGVPFTTAQLDVGDFLIQTTEGRPLLVGERKSHADFAASNTDGRYREQRGRLMAVRGSGVAVLYVLEGVWATSGSTSGSDTDPKGLRRLTTRLTLRYGLPVLFSDSLKGTAEWCRVLLAQLTDDPTVFEPEGEDAKGAAMAGFTAALSATKKGNKTASSTSHAILSGIPGLGQKRIVAILGERSVADLVGLSAAEIAALQAGGKKLGPALGTLIYEAFHWKQ